jgi:hypothetical protein
MVSYSARYEIPEVGTGHVAIPLTGLEHAQVLAAMTWMAETFALSPSELSKACKSAANFLVLSMDVSAVVDPSVFEKSDTVVAISIMRQRCRFKWEATLLRETSAGDEGGSSRRRGEENLTTPTTENIMAVAERVLAEMAPLSTTPGKPGQPEIATKHLRRMLSKVGGWLMPLYPTRRTRVIQGVKDDMAIMTCHLALDKLGHTSDETLFTETEEQANRRGAHFHGELSPMLVVEAAVEGETTTTGATESLPPEKKFRFRLSVVCDEAVGNFADNTVLKQPYANNATAVSLFHARWDMFRDIMKRDPAESKLAGKLGELVEVAGSGGAMWQTPPLGASLAIKFGVSTAIRDALHGLRSNDGSWFLLVEHVRPFVFRGGAVDGSADGAGAGVGVGAGAGAGGTASVPGVSTSGAPRPRVDTAGRGGTKEGRMPGSGGSVGRSEASAPPHFALRIDMRMVPMSAFVRTPEGGLDCAPVIPRVVQRTAVPS